MILKITANRNGVSESNPTLRNLKQINAFKIRHWKLSYGIFFLITSFKEEEVKWFCICFSVVWGTVKIPKFSISICHALRGPGDLAQGGECSPFPSAVFTPTFLLFFTLHSCTFSLDTHQLDAMLKCLEEPELPGAAPGPVGTCWKTLFSRTVSAQLFDEFNSSCHGVNSVWCRWQREGSLYDCCSPHVQEGEMKEKDKRRQKSGEDTI